jgi:hypothetical protein
MKKGFCLSKQMADNSRLSIFSAIVTISLKPQRNYENVNLKNESLELLTNISIEHFDRKLMQKSCILFY